MLPSDGIFRPALHIRKYPRAEADGYQADIRRFLPLYGKEKFCLKSQKKSAYLAKVGILSAIAGALMFLEIPLWFAPTFYKLDFSDIIALLGGFSLGPAAGAVIELIKNLLHILIKGTSTGFVGELANFLTGCALVMPAALFYKVRRTKTSAVLGMLTGTLCLAGFGAILNYYVLIPVYSKFLPIDAIIEMGNKINPKITNLKMLIVWAVVPFNLFKGIIDSVFMLLFYKRLAFLLKKE